ncbi:unnamed protein product, partial [Mycena citricolor]
MWFKTSRRVAAAARTRCVPCMESQMFRECERPSRRIFIGESCIDSTQASSQGEGLSVNVSCCRTRPGRRYSELVSM